MSSDEEKEVKYRRRKRDPQDAQYRPQDDLKVPKKPKPVGAPKRPKSAYTLYMAASYKDYKEENPEMKTKEIFKEIAASWKDIDNDAKKQFEEEAKREREEYKEKNDAFKKSGKYKRYKHELKEWNEVYRDEYEQELYEKELKRKEAKQNSKEKKKTAKKKRRRKKKST